MGYFLHKFGIQMSAINEAEADGQDMSDPNDQPAEYGADDTMTNETDTGTEEQNSDNEPQDSGDHVVEEPSVDNSDEESTMDYNDADMNSGNEENGNSGESVSADTEEEQPVNDIKRQEEEIYNNANMTPEQLDIKHKELKSQFLAMYDLTSSIIDRIGDASINEENIAVVEFISENLSRLRTMLTDYIESVYAGKSYIENAVTFNRFLATLNGINKMLEQIEKKEDK